MGLFGLFGSKNSSETEEKKLIPWNQLTSMELLEVISEESKTTPVAIFKHSTRCGISRMVINQFESNYNIDPEQMKL